MMAFLFSSNIAIFLWLRKRPWPGRWDDTAGEGSCLVTQEQTLWAAASAGQRSGPVHQPGARFFSGRRLWPIGRKPLPASVAGLRPGLDGSDWAQSPAKAARGWGHALTGLDGLIGDLGFRSGPVGGSDSPCPPPPGLINPSSHDP